MKKNTICVVAEIDFCYDENSMEFKRTYESYRERIDKTMSVDDMLLDIAGQISTYGTDKLIEGIGYVSVFGKMPEKEWCGIDVEVCTVDNKVNFEVYPDL